MLGQMREPASGDIEIRPVTPDQHDALMHFFDLVAYADNPDWSRCYCMFPLLRDYQQKTRDENRAARSALVRAGEASGLVAYRLGRVVGWCHPAPTTEVVTIPDPKPDVGAIVCFVVAPDQRRQGIATALLDGALGYLKERGCREVVAAPLTAAAADARSAAANYHGPLDMYLRAGFTVGQEVAPGQVLVRRSL
ncbi:MAG: GNAT family N-acetyltransferase [Candidatus Limnocylindria bacterium]